MACPEVRVEWEGHCLMGWESLTYNTCVTETEMGLNLGPLAADRLMGTERMEHYA